MSVPRAVFVLLFLLVAVSTASATGPKAATHRDPGAPCYSWPAVDYDQDGVFDRLDYCNNTPKGCIVDKFGCQLDSDGDGVCDGIDQCPGTPKGESVNEVGCRATQTPVAMVPAAPPPTPEIVPRSPRPPLPPFKHESMVTVTLGSQAPHGAFSDLAKSGSMAGLSAGYRVTRWLATGVDFTYFRSPGTHDGDAIDIFEPSTQKIVSITLAENWTVTELGLYAKAFVLERGRFSPYLRVGAGAYSIRYSQDVSAASTTTTLGGSEQASKFGVSGGAGLRFRVVGGTSLGIETLYHGIIAKNARVNLLTTGLTIAFGPTGN